MNLSRRSRAMLAPAVDNWPSRCYLAAVVLASGSALYEDLFVSQADASMAFVLPLLLALPLDLVFIALPAGMATGAFFYVGIAVGALVNAAILGAAVRGIRSAVRRGRRPSMRTAPSA